MAIPACTIKIVVFWCYTKNAACVSSYDTKKYSDLINKTYHFLGTVSVYRLVPIRFTSTRNVTFTNGRGCSLLTLPTESNEEWTDTSERIHPQARKALYVSSNWWMNHPHLLHSTPSPIRFHFLSFLVFLKNRLNQPKLAKLNHLDL